MQKFGRKKCGEPNKMATKFKIYLYVSYAEKQKTRKGCPEIDVLI